MRMITPLVLGIVLMAGAIGEAEAQVRVPGFTPAGSGFDFPNSFPSTPHLWLDIGIATIPIGDATNGLCGGMAFAARDFFEAGLQRPTTNSPPTSGPLYYHLVQRLYDSFNLPVGPARYMHLMNPNLPDNETRASRWGLAPHGRAWVTIREEWPRIKADLDSGRLSPMALILVKTSDIFQIGRNHQVVAWGYDLVGSDLTILVYDPSAPNRDDVAVTLNISNPVATTEMRFGGRKLWAFFRPNYTFQQPLGLAEALLVQEQSSVPVYVIVGGARLWITSPTELEDHFGGWDRIRVVADGTATLLPTVPRDGTIVLESSGSRVFLIEGGTRRWITSPTALEEFGGWGVVRLVPNGSVASLPEGPPIHASSAMHSPLRPDDRVPARQPLQ